MDTVRRDEGSLPGQFEGEKKKKNPERQLKL